ncbi:MAG: Uma2 family endonuclease [Aestuariivita sp.]|nr:Uma2 family endonuclease [Aestuariivita sp.]MCY4203017.1 Uma2 family endonuclease [Aestuariivita sp.]
MHLSADIVVPNVASWRRDTMPDYTASAYCEIPPDWVCEVLSPSTRRIDQIEKRVIYVREKVSHLRFIDPDEKTMEAFEWRQGYWVLPKTLADNETASIAPFEVISFPLDSL